MTNELGLAKGRIVHTFPGTAKAFKIPRGDGGRGLCLGINWPPMAEDKNTLAVDIRVLTVQNKSPFLLINSMMVQNT